MAEKIHPETRIGHIHLKVADIERSLKFYRDILGFQVKTKMGNSAVFLASGDYHHHIGLNTWESKDGKQPPASATGLYHFAILMPNRKELARMVQNLLHAKWPIDGTADHGVSESIYIEDPDGNGIEIYTDKPKEKWQYDASGQVIMYTEPLDIENLMMELEKEIVQAADAKQSAQATS